MAAKKQHKKSFPLRVNAEVLESMKRWSDDELRSLNGQIEYVLREALRKQGRLKKKVEAEATKEAEDE